jgi:(2R)-3-sulfolactate dehydrogenase (NADP+)
MLALVVELLCVALSGAAFGFEADSFFVDAGNRPRLGQAFWVIDPAALAGSDTYFARLETLIAAMTEDEAVRLPGARRVGIAANAATNGIEVADAMLADLQKLSA